PDVEQPVALVIWLLGRRIKQVLSAWVFLLEPNLYLERTCFVEQKRRYAVEFDEWGDALELPVGVIPEHDPGIFLSEKPLESDGYLLGVHRYRFNRIWATAAQAGTSLLLLSARNGVDLSEQIAELRVVSLHA